VSSRRTRATFITKKGFSAGNPELRTNLATIYLPIGDIGQIAVEMANGKTEPQAVDEWWKKNAGLIEQILLD
jgi:glycine betaine/proline transport system substrate-binding protein